MRSLLKSVCILLLVLGATSLALAQLPPGATATTVMVDCSKGQSINHALARNARVLVVQVRGACEETVLVSRDDVTLRGRGPALDSIRSLATEGGIAAVRIHNAARIALENLTLFGDSGYGVKTSNVSDLDLENLVIEGGPGFGAFLRATEARVTDTEFRDNRVGLRIDQASFVRCERCATTGTVSWGFAAFDSRLHLLDSTTSATEAAFKAVSGRTYVERGDFEGVVKAHQGAEVSITGGAVVHGDSSGVAVQVEEQSTVRVWDSTLYGLAWVLTGAHLRLESNATLDAGAGISTVADNATVEIQDYCATTGTWRIEEFSRLVVHGTSTHAGAIECNMGGDVWCVDPSGISGGCTGCASCVTP